MTTAQLLERFPFPEGWADAKRIERVFIYDLPGTPEALWPFIADTSRMNRALGLSEMTFVEKEGKRWGSSKNGGVRHEWLEPPWNWVAEQWLTAVRLYDRGFMKVMYAIHHLEKIDSGTRVYLYFGAVPRGVFGATALRLGFPSLKRAYDRVLPALAKQGFSGEVWCSEPTAALWLFATAIPPANSAVSPAAPAAAIPVAFLT